jgi:hypothetical protein
MFRVVLCRTADCRRTCDAVSADIPGIPGDICLRLLRQHRKDMPNRGGRPIGADGQMMHVKTTDVAWP